MKSTAGNTVTPAHTRIRTIRGTGTMRRIGSEGTTGKTWKQRFKSAFLGTVLGLSIPSLVLAQTATLLPDAKQRYFNDQGVPVANGQVFYYVPSTTTPKTIWQDAAETTPQANPVQLDSGGKPQPAGQTYGAGSYRQKVVDSNGVTVWDAVTTSTGSGGSSGPAFSEGVMVGTILAWANTTLPNHYLYTAGQAVSRTTFAQLLTAITYQTPILCQSGVASISVSTTISDSVPIGAPVEASCFAPGTTVSAKTSGQLTLSNVATTTASVSATIFPWGDGDGSTTFNVPDLRGRVMPGRDNMNSSVAGVLVSSVYGSNPDAVNAVGGSLSTSLKLNQIPQGITSNNAAQAISVTSTPTNVVQGTLQSSNAGGGGNIQLVNGAISTAIVSTGNNNISVTSNNTGNGQAVSATVGAGGSGYSAGTQTLTVTGGTCSINPQFQVTISGGAITAPVLQTAGQCTSVAANPAATTGGGGTGGTLNVTYAPLPLGTIPPSVTADYIIKATPDDSPTGPGVTSIGGMTGAIICGTGVTCNANTISSTGSLTVGAPISGGTNNTVLIDVGGLLATSATLPSGLTYPSPTIDTVINWTFGGTATGAQTIGNPASTSPVGSFITTWQGVTPGGTTALHLLPNTGPLIGTITSTEVVTGATPGQAFGSNYGRWSYSNFANTRSGIVGEYGGTVTPPDYVLQNAYESPPSVFTVYEFWRAKTTDGGAEDAQVGAVLFGSTQPNPGTQQNRIVLVKPNIGSAGTRNSDRVLWEGKANNGIERAAWWGPYVNVTSNAGASQFCTQSNLNNAGYVTQSCLTDGGVFNVTTGFQVGGAATSGNVLRGNGTNFVSAQLATTDLSGLGTGVATALGVNVGTVGAFVVNGGTATSITFPLHIGGSAAGSSAEIRATSSGAATGDLVKITVGNNGASQAVTVRDSDALCGFAGCTVFGTGTTNPANLGVFASPAGQHSILQIVNNTTGYTGGNGTFFGVLNGTKEFRFDQQENDNIFFITNGQGATGGFSGAGRIFASAAWAIGNACVGTDMGTDNVKICGAYSTKVPTTLTGTSGTVGAADSSIIVNASGTFTLTLPAAASPNNGRVLRIKSIAAQIVNSASSNVVPISTATAGTAIFPATAGKYVTLQSDGTNWISMVAN